MKRGQFFGASWRLLLTGFWLALLALCVSSHSWAQPALSSASAQRQDTAATQAQALSQLYNLQLPDLKGQNFALSQLKGKVTIVNFWATWCGPCVREMPELDRLAKQHPKLNVVGFAIDSAENIQNFQKKVQVSYPLLVGGPKFLKLMRQLGNPKGGLPFTLILNEKGQVIHKILGELNPEKLQQVLQKIST
ncbi:TlpA family protein disulfide reductase [Brackiella oedipodis]|uniref:TlpA family protein disulfide reductase n=1 Tax=Brackiella oedipodis TaxID=124225 RepID=UPI0006886020|nr:TlpA disulfide reductase family protein [Brackiella oedipodis]